VTDDVILQLKKDGFPDKYLKSLPTIIGTPFTPADALIQAVQKLTLERLTVVQEDQLLAAALRYTIGPSVTDTPIRQTVYFGIMPRTRAETGSMECSPVMTTNLYEFLAGVGARSRRTAAYPDL